MDPNKLTKILSNAGSRNQIFGRPGTMNFTVEWQLEHLGLDKQKVAKLKGEKVLDLGCGVGTLVNYLITKGVLAEGISPDAPRGKNFIGQKVESIYPSKGSIPREEEHYDRVFANAVNALTLAFSSQREAAREQGRVHAGGNLVYLRNLDTYLMEIGIEGYSIMMEALRVLKKGGKFICSPFMDKLQMYMGPELSKGNYKIEKEPIALVSRLVESAKKKSWNKKNHGIFWLWWFKRNYPKFLKIQNDYP